MENTLDGMKWVNKSISAVFRSAIFDLITLSTEKSINEWKKAILTHIHTSESYFLDHKICYRYWKNSATIRLLKQNLFFSLFLSFDKTAFLSISLSSNFTLIIFCGSSDVGNGSDISVFILKVISKLLKSFIYSEFHKSFWHIIQLEIWMETGVRSVHFSHSNVFCMCACLQIQISHILSVILILHIYWACFSAFENC